MFFIMYFYGQKPTMVGICHSGNMPVSRSVEGEKYLQIYSKLNKIPFNVVKIEQMLTIWIKVEKNTFKYG